jgi:cyclophilin family peptidyl-prolyl cis-trans isomerase
MKIKLILITWLCLSAIMLAVGCSSDNASTTTAAASQSPATKTTTTSAVSSTTVQTTAVTQTTTPPRTTAPSTTTATAAVKQWSQPPAMQIDTAKKYTAAVETSSGSFTIELFASESPKTVNNFVFLSREGFYNGIIFHRIIKDFMVQTGDPLGTGMGGPGYKFNDELPVKHKYDPGIVAMANAGANTNGSQFFICTGPTAANLNQAPNYTQFGRVIVGMDIVMKIASVETVLGSDRAMSKPVNPPVIKSITITES